jgi:hypothetical protein
MVQTNKVELSTHTKLQNSRNNHLEEETIKIGGIEILETFTCQK